MLTSKKQEWILKMIKGPDITPVHNAPGHYSSKTAVSISTGDQQITINPSDVLDLSNAEYLYINQGVQTHAIAWDDIVALDFEDLEEMTAIPQRNLPAAPHRLFSIPLGKKVV